MIETSAHLVDHVIPEVPTRQWVLSFPWPLRLLFNSRPTLLSRVLAVVVRAIETDLIHRAGLTRKARARCGVITLIQRFGSALNLNVHLHMLVLDGVYTEHQGRARFHPVTATAAERMKQLLDRIITRTLRQLVNQGALVEDTDQPWLNLQDPIPWINSARLPFATALRSVRIPAGTHWPSLIRD